MESSQITLAQIGLYNPQRLTDQQSKQLFSVRHQQFEQLLDCLKRTYTNDVPQHQLVVALRGMGKSTLLKRIEVELRNSPWNKDFIPLLFPEEQYNIKNLAEFWFNCIDALADTLEQERSVISSISIDEIDRIVQGMIKIIDDHERANRAYEFLNILVRMLKRRPVLLIDNLNMIFDRMNETDQYNLRACMNTQGAPVIIGASSILFDETIHYDAPFYDAFQIIHLDRLTMQEMTTMLVNLANTTGETSLIPSIQEHEARIKALLQLTGGNPRTAVMFFRLIQRGFSNDINDDLEGLLDELTPVYKARFEELSPQAQIIMDSIAMNWDPISLEKLREVTRLENNKLSPQLKRLTESGWIEKPITQQGKGGTYEISERIFNIWYLMRRSSRRQKRSIFCLSKFMEVYYGEEIKEMARHYLAATFTTNSQAITALAIARVTTEQQTKEKLCGKSRDYIFSHFNTEELLQLFDCTDLYATQDQNELFNQLFQKWNTEKWDEATYLAHTLISQADSNELKAYQYALLSWIELYQNQWDKAFTHINQGLSLNTNDPFLYNNLGLYYFYIHDSEKGKAACEKAISINANLAFPYFTLAYHYYDEKQMYKEAEIYYRKVCDILPQNDYFQISLAKNLMRQEKDSDAAEIYESLIKQEPDNLQLHCGLGELYIKMNEWEKAEENFRLVLNNNPKDIDALIGLGMVFLNNYNFKEAEEILEQAYNENPENDMALLALSFIYSMTNQEEKSFQTLQNRLLKKKTDSIYLCVAQSAKNLGLYNEAIGYYQEAIREQMATNKTWYELGNLYMFYLHDFDKAENTYTEGLKVYPDSVELLIGLLHLKRDYVKLSEIETKPLFQQILSKQTSSTDFIVQYEQILFSLQQQNLGIVKEQLAAILPDCQPKDLIQEQEKWCYLSAQFILNRQLDIFLEQLELYNKQIEWAPFYHAIKAVSSGKVEEYMDTTAQEYRDIAIEMAKDINYYL